MAKSMHQRRAVVDDDHIVRDEQVVLHEPGEVVHVRLVGTKDVGKDDSDAPPAQRAGKVGLPDQAGEGGLAAADVEDRVIAFLHLVLDAALQPRLYVHGIVGRRLLNLRMIDRQAARHVLLVGIPYRRLGPVLVEILDQRIEDGWD